MTAQLSRERRDIIEQTANHIISREDTSEHSENLRAVAELALLALAEMESEPVAYFYPGDETEWQGVALAEELDDEQKARCIPLYASPPAPVIPGELHPDTQKLVADFCAALAEKLYKAQLKYGYDADWKQDGWPTQCQAHFHQHIAKGDPRDVAAYCAFMWYHGWKTKPAPVTVPDELTCEEYKRRFMEEDNFDDTYRGGWEACRAAMLKAGPVTAATVPDGWTTNADANDALVMLDRIDTVDCDDDERIESVKNIIRRLAAAHVFGNFRENENSSTNNFRENSETSTNRSREHFISLCNQFWNWQEFDEINAGDEEPRLGWDGKEFTHRVTQALWRMYQAAPEQEV